MSQYIDVCSYTDLTFNSLKFKQEPNNNKINNIIKYISIKKNNNDLLFVMSPWTKHKYSFAGVVDKSYEKTKIDYPMEYKIVLDDTDDAQLDFINKIKDLDEYFQSDEFKNKYLPKKYKGNYNSIYNEKYKWIKAKLQYNVIDNNKMLSTKIYNAFSYPTSPNKFLKKELIEITDAFQLKNKIEKNRNVRFILYPSSIWYTNSSYGLKIKIFEIQIGSNKQEFNYYENN